MAKSDHVSPKDVFLDIWTVATLYVSAGFLISLLFDFVNYYLPDAANPYFSANSLRWSVAILLTIFPTHVIAQWLLQKEYQKEPAKRERRLHKWLLYLTLFLAAIAIVVDLATLIYNFLGGELSARFILKVLSVALVAGGILSYYILDLRREGVKLSSGSLWLVRGLVAFVGVAVIGAFFVAGSPFRQREVKIDEQRLGHLQMIQNEIVYNYWQNKRELPPSLEALRNNITGFAAPVDPETKSPYEYLKTGDLSFELCGVFTTSNLNDPKAVFSQPAFPYGASPDNWQHASGRVCFVRTIDPSLYPKTPAGIPPGAPAPVPVKPAQ